MSRTAASRPGRVGRPWREVSARVYAEESHCWLCAGHVDQRLVSTHRLARSADHLIQLQHGGDPLARANLRLAHIGCNTARSNALRTLDRSDCACSMGQPCRRVVPEYRRGLVALDPGEV